MHKNYAVANMGGGIYDDRITGVGLDLEDVVVIELDLWVDLPLPLSSIVVEEAVSSGAGRGITLGRYE